MAAAPQFQTLKANVKLGTGQALGFTRGRGYYARPVATAPPASSSQGGLQPLTGAQIANEIAGYVNQLPAPLTDQQIQQKASDLMSPIVAAISSQITGAEQTGAHAISGYSQQLAQNLAGLQPQIAGVYSNAEQQQAAADAAESSAVNGGGLQAANQLSSTLAQMQAPSGAQAAVAAPLATSGSGAAAAMLGTGSAFLDKLIAEGTNANVLAAKQPGFALAQGQQDISNLSLASQKQLADSLSTEQQQLPGIVQNLQSQSDTNQANRANAGESATQYYTSRNDALYAGQAKNQTAITVAGEKALATKYGIDTRAAVSKYGIDVRAKTAGEAAASKASQDNFNNRVKFAKAYGYDPVTGQPLPGYSRAANGTITKAATPAKPLTAKDVVSLVQQWHDGKPLTTTDIVKGKAVTNNAGNPVKVTTAVGKVNYQQAYKMLRLYGQSDQAARTALNTVYSRGDNGRAWLTNEEQAALGKSGLQTTASKGVLSPKQAAALKRAGFGLPAGKYSKTGQYVINNGVS